MSKPVFVLLHGAWHTPSCWDRLIAQLDAAGYTSVAPALPSLGSNPPTPDWSRDVEIIRDTVSNLVVEHDVVVVTHSFSGMTGGTALEGLDKGACLSKGLKGGVVRIVYIAAFLVPEGFQHSPRGTRENMVPEMKTDLEVCRVVRNRLPVYYLRCQTGIITVAPEDAKGLFYQDVDDVTVAELVKDLRPQSFASFWYGPCLVIPAPFSRIHCTI